MPIEIQFVSITIATLSAIGILWYIIILYNGLVGLCNHVRKSWADIDVLLKQRADELPNLVEAVKGYMQYERETLEKLTKARTDFVQAQSVHDKARADSEISSAVKTLFAVAENYPDLKASQNFLRLQERITGLENEIADRREFYNASVNTYNTRIQSFPDLIFAKLFRFKNWELFEVENSAMPSVGGPLNKL